MKQLLILIVVAMGVTYLSNNNEYVEVPSTSIRMRVIANSNDELDQENKQEVKSLVEKELYGLIEKGDTEDVIERKIVENKDMIDNNIREFMASRNMDIGFSSNFGVNYFPEKEFKGLTYKAGNYKSFVVELGAAKGENWWCVLYPPLCLIDEDVSEYVYHSLIKDALMKYN